MIDIEKQIKDYINNFYTNEEWSILSRFVNTENIQNDTEKFDKDYLKICSNILCLISEQLTNKYRIEIDEHCRCLIKKLFKQFVDDETFVVTSCTDHQAITALLNPKIHSYVIDTFQIFNDQEFIIKNILNKFQESHCKKIFFIMAATATQSTVTVDQSFFESIKKTLTNYKLPHIMVLDDCQSIFMIERNYEIFDAFLATGHVLNPVFSNLGIMFTKLPEQIGFLNKKILNEFYPKFKIIKSHKEKALQFNNLMSEYFQSCLQQNNFQKIENIATHQFAVSLNNIITQDKFSNELMKYNIKFNPIKTSFNFVRIRYHEAILQDPDEFIKGINKTRKILNKLRLYHEISDKVPEYDNSKYEISAKHDDIYINKKILLFLNEKQSSLIKFRFFGNMKTK